MNDGTVIKGVFHQSVWKYRDCYSEHELSKNPNSKIYIKVSATIKKTGVFVVKSIYNLQDGDFKTCLVKQLENTKFPPVANGEPLEVKQPFNFYPKVKNKW